MVQVFDWNFAPTSPEMQLFMFQCRPDFQLAIREQWTLQPENPISFAQQKSVEPDYKRTRGVVIFKICKSTRNFFPPPPKKTEDSSSCPSIDPGAHSSRAANFG